MTKKTSVKKTKKNLTKAQQAEKIAGLEKVFARHGCHPTLVIVNKDPDGPVTLDWVYPCSLGCPEHSSGAPDRGFEANVKAEMKRALDLCFCTTLRFWECEMDANDGRFKGLLDKKLNEFFESLDAVEEPDLPVHVHVQLHQEGHPEDCQCETEYLGPKFFHAVKGVLVWVLRCSLGCSKHNESLEGESEVARREKLDVVQNAIQQVRLQGGKAVQIFDCDFNHGQETLERVLDSKMKKELDKSALN
jgi:hypothetical protein